MFQDVNITCICRTCLTTKNILFSTDSKCKINGKLCKISDMLSETCTDTNIYLNGELANRLCSDCIISLRQAYLFKQQCLQAESKWLAISESLNVKYSPNSKNASGNRLDLVELLQSEFEEVDLLSDIEEDLQNEENVLFVYDKNNIDQVDLVTEMEEENCTLTQSIVLNSQSKAQKHYFVLKQPLKNENGNTKEASGVEHSPEPAFDQEECDDVKIEEDEAYNNNYDSKSEEYIFDEEQDQLSNCDDDEQEVVAINDTEETEPVNNTDNVDQENSKKPYKCFCGNSYCWKSDLSKHKRNKHKVPYNANLEYTCEACTGSFVNQEELNNHIVEYHSNGRECNASYMCPECEKIFTSKDNLFSHMMVHSNDRPCLCNECGKTFKDIKRLRLHMMVHSNERPYVCNIDDCTKSYKTTCALLVHKKRHKGEMKFSCETCGKFFMFRGSLKSHERVHSDVKQFKCTMCTMSFKAKCTLVAHLRTHTGEKPYACEVCDMRFTVSGSLHAHVRRHLREKCQKISKKSIKAAEAKARAEERRILQAGKKKRPSAIITKMKNYVEEVVKSYDDITFQNTFRMNRTIAYKLIGSLEKSGDIPSHAEGVEKISCEKAFLLTLWYLANTGTFREIAERFDVSLSSAHRSLVRVLNFILKLREDYIRWPTEDECTEIAAEYKSKHGIDNVVGIIDACHVKIKVTKHDNKEIYSNRNGFHSILIQGVITVNNIFIDVFCGEPGSLYDAELLEKSSLYNNAADPAYFGDSLILGDSAYPALSWLVPPFDEDGIMEEEEKLFNIYHSAARSTVDAFGLLKGRFRRLQQFQNIDIKTVTRCIMAACVLHNYCILENDDTLIELPNISQDLQSHSCDLVHVLSQNISGRNKAFYKLFSI